MGEAMLTFLDDLADKDLGEACDDLGDGLRDLLAEGLLDDLESLSTGVDSLTVGYTLRTACFGRACRRYASKRSYCSGLRLSMSTLADTQSVPAPERARART